MMYVIEREIKRGAVMRRGEGKGKGEREKVRGRRGRGRGERAK